MTSTPCNASPTIQLGGRGYPVRTLQGEDLKAVAEMLLPILQLMRLEDAGDDAASEALDCSDTVVRLKRHILKIGMGLPDAAVDQLTLAELDDAVAAVALHNLEGLTVASGGHPLPAGRA